MNRDRRLEERNEGMTASLQMQEIEASRKGNMLTDKNTHKQAQRMLGQGRNLTVTKAVHGTRSAERRDPHSSLLVLDERLLVIVDYSHGAQARRSAPRRASILIALRHRRECERREGVGKERRKRGQRHGR